MIKHTVLFRFRSDVSAAERDDAFRAFKDGIMNLRGRIAEIVEIEVGRNVNDAEKWDICLSGTFRTMAEVETYSTHPEHVAVAGALKQFLDGRCCVDYEID